MKPLVIKPVNAVRGIVAFTGDKSIAHRAVILSALSQGLTTIENFPANKDCIYTVSALSSYGVKIKSSLTDKRKSILKLIVNGNGLYGLKPPKKKIFVGASGTTLRLLVGLASGQKFSSHFYTDSSLARRPMRRITEPLRLMGAIIKSQVTSHKSQVEEYPPLSVFPASLKGIKYTLPVASAQVKSAILLAGLYASGEIKIIEKEPTRDHTERMFKFFRAELHCHGKNIRFKARKVLVSPGRIYVPGDISSAAFFLVMATLLKRSRLVIKKVSLNPTRIGIIDVLKRMGANIKINLSKDKVSAFEPMGDIIISSSVLRAVRIQKEQIPALVDELPILMVAASLSKGKSVFEGVNELRVKETDRIKSMVEGLRRMGADISVRKSFDKEIIEINGINCLHAANLKSYGDHRTAMSLVVAAMLAVGVSKIDDISCVNKSFPNFLKTIIDLRGQKFRPRRSKKAR